jgi:hypothetical protein
MFQEEAKAIFVPPLSEALIAFAASQAEADPFGRLVSFVGLNPDNYLKLINSAIAGRNTAFLSANRYSASLNPQLPALLALESDVKTNFMKEMCDRLCQAEKEKIADEVFFEAAALPAYVEFLPGIEFMALRNNFNWRVLIDYLSKEFASSNLASLLLEYNEYIGITHQLSADYDTQVRRQAIVFQKYVELLEMKVETIFAGSPSQEELQLKFTNELTFLNLLLGSFQMRTVASKLGLLHRTMKEHQLEVDLVWP